MTLKVQENKQNS